MQIMKSKVKLSAYCTFVTALIIVLILALIVLTRGKGIEFYILSAVLIGLVLSGLYYYPTEIVATNDAVVIKRVLQSKTIPCTTISSAARCWPSAGGLRLLGSGGFMGYWGYFSDIIIGTYFGYYGNRNQCIQLKLKDGKQYVISCLDPDAMVTEINRNL